MVEKSQIGSLWPHVMDPLRNLGARVAEWVAPASDASEANGAYHITVELPGVAEEDVDITVDKGVLSVKGEKRTSREESGETWYFSERQFGAFSRSFRLPADADQEAVAAELKDGVLTITVPKQSDGSENGAKKVAINTA